MEARLDLFGNQVAVKVLKYITSAHHVVAKSKLPDATAELMRLRASQINGCSVCVDLGTRSARKAGETDDRLHMVAVWREAPCFTDAERAGINHPAEGGDRRRGAVLGDLGAPGDPRRGLPELDPTDPGGGGMTSASWLLTRRTLIQFPRNPMVLGFSVAPVLMMFVVFGALFASADALFARWVDAPAWTVALMAVAAIAIPH